MNSDIEYSTDSRGKLPLIESGSLKKALSEDKIDDIRFLSLPKVVKATPRKQTISVKQIKSRYDAQLEEISKCLGIWDTKLGKIQAVQLLQGMTLDDIHRIKNRVIREKFYAAKASNIEIQYKELKLDPKLKNKKDFQLKGNVFSNEIDSAIDATKDHSEKITHGIINNIEGLDLDVFEEFTENIENLQTSLEVVSAAMGITITAKDLTKGVSHYRKLYMLNRNLKKIKKEQFIVEMELDELANIEKNKNGNKKEYSTAPVYTELFDEIMLRKKELEISSYAIKNAKNILKEKLEDDVTEAVFAGVPASATLSGVIITRVGTAAASSTAQVVVGSVIGGLQIVEGGVGIVTDFIDLKDLKVEKKEIQSLHSDSLEKNVNQVFFLVIDLKLDNLEHYQKQQVYLHLTEDALSIISGVGGILGAVGIVGAQGVVIGASATQAIIQLSNFVYNHRSDVNDLVHLRNPPVFKRINVGYKIHSKTKNVRRNSLYLQNTLQKQALILGDGKEAIHENLDTFKELEILKPKWEFLDALVAERLMIDRASSNIRDEARNLAGHINAMKDQEFIDFKQELISKRILKPTSVNKNKAGVIKEINKFIKSRGALVGS